MTVWLGWTDENIQKLPELWRGSMSASKIAEELGAPSRHVIIGKAWRMQLGAKKSAQANVIASNRTLRKRGADARPRSPSTPRTSRPKLPSVMGSRMPTGVAIMPVEIEEAPFIAGPGVTIMELDSSNCRWPNGDPKDLETFRYCGEHAISGHSYCSHHFRMSRGGGTVGERRATHI